MDYEHTQDSKKVIVVVASVFAIVIFSLVATLARSEDSPAFLMLLTLVWFGVLYAVIINFTRLTVHVGPAAIDLSWRLGWPTKTIDRGTVVRATKHRNSWLEGLGIRKVRRGWMWNVWGFDSVELELDSGKVFRIGTDDAEGLMAALSR